MIRMATMLAILIIGLMAGPGGVLVGVADRVAGDRRLVGGRALAAVRAVLDQLLGVVPGAATRRHRDGQEEARDDVPTSRPPRASIEISRRRSG
jgi:hypothetical protein